MRQSEIHYRKAHHAPFSSGHRGNQPQPRGSAAGEVEQKIVTLYKNGQSIEAITREVGRARHLVVHILHSTGVFGTVQTTPSRDAEGSIAIPEHESVPEAPQSDPSDAVIPRPEVKLHKATSTVKRIRRSKPLESSTVPAPAAAASAPPASPTARTTGKWSPLVVDALYKVVTQLETDSGMSVEELQRMVVKPRRSRTSRI